jgi:hypothetical protein
MTYFRHGHATKRNRTPEYQAWIDMKKRCFNPRHPRYRYWGGKGITVDPRWVNNYPAFYAYVGPRPSPNYELDRLLPDGNYEPGNVRWHLRGQGRTRCSRLVTFSGQTLTIAQWSRRIGIPYDTLYGRLAKGWSIDQALGQAVRPKQAKARPRQAKSLAYRIIEALQEQPSRLRNLATALDWSYGYISSTLTRLKYLGLVDNPRPGLWRLAAKAKAA